MQGNLQEIKAIIQFIACTALCMGLSCLWADATGAQKAMPPSLSEIVLFGVRPITELNPALYKKDGRHCVQAYLDAITPKSRLTLARAPSDYAGAVAARKQIMVEQMTTILGEQARKEAELFATAVPLANEWEGMSEGPVEEANFVDNWFSKRPETSAAIAPFLHLFKAHRLRAGFEAAKFGHEKGLWPILAKRYHEAFEKAKSYENPLISCIADDLDAQPYVYLEGQGRP